MPGTEAAVARRWLRVPLLLGTLAAGAAGQYWLSVDHVAAWSAWAWSAAALGFVVLYLLGRDVGGVPSLASDEMPRHVEWVLFAVVLACGAFFTLFRLATIPPGLNHDAAWEGMYAIRILNGEPYKPYVNEAWGRETFTFYLRAASIWLMGPTRLAVTAPSMVAGVLTLPFFYWWARNTFGARCALLATLLLGASGWHVMFSRTGWRSDFQPFFTVLTCCFFIRGMITAGVVDFAVSGVALALTVNTYNAARALPILFPLWLVLSLAQSWRLRGFLRRYAAGLAAMALAGGVTIAPLAWFAVHHWSIFQSRAVALEGSTSLWSGLKQTALLFNYRSNGDDFFTTTPGLEYPTALFLAFGCLWALTQLRDERVQFVVLGLLVNALPGIVSKPNMNRDIGTMPFIYFLVALGVFFFAQQLRRLVPRIGAAAATVFVAAVGVAAMQATYAQYFGAHRRPIWGYYPETTVLGDYMKTLVPHYQIWVGDVSYFPRDALTYLSYQGYGNPERRNYTWVDDATTVLRRPPIPPPGKGLAFLFENEGRGALVLDALARRYPKHETVALRYPPEHGRVFAKAVLVPADGVAVAGNVHAALPPDTAALGPPQASAGALQQPRGVAVRRTGDVLVCDFGHNRVQEFGPDLRFVRQWGTSGALPAQFNQPCGIAVTAGGEVLVADTWNQRVQVFSTTGQFERQWSAGFFGPRGIAVDAQGRVFVADTGNNRVLRFAADGRLEREWGGRGSTTGHFMGPVGLAVDAGGAVYVCDNGNGRLQVFTGDGRFLRAFPVSGWADRAYSEPYVTFDERDTLWVTVPTAHEIRNYDRAGRLLRTITPRSLAGVTFDVPLGIAYDAVGHRLIVTDLDNRLLRIPLR